MYELTSVIYPYGNRPAVPCAIRKLRIRMRLHAHMGLELYSAKQNPFIDTNLMHTATKVSLLL